VATAYLNEGGTGRRIDQIVVTAAMSIHGDIRSIVDGNTTTPEGWWFNGQSVTSSINITFDFGDTSYVIDEAIFYEQSATSQGTWQWQGSNDGTTWTNIGSNFALGSSATQTITALNGNTTAYKLYRMLGVSGGTSSSPYIYGMEFKISPPQNRSNGTSYLNSGGTGNRTSIITATTGGSLPFNGSGISPQQNSLDGFYSNTVFYINNSTSTGNFLTYDFGSPKLIDEVCLYFNGANYGTWKWQGSNDNSTWTDVGSSFTLLGSGDPDPIKIASMNGNVTPYRFLRIICVTGAAYGGDGNFQETEFRITTATVTGALLTNKGMDGGMRPQMKGGMNG
jgi:hypothetical protein